MFFLVPFFAFCCPRCLERHSIGQRHASEISLDPAWHDGVVMRDAPVLFGAFFASSYVVHDGLAVSVGRHYMWYCGHL